MSDTSVLQKTLRDQRWQVLGFGLALFSMALTAVLLWPSVRDTLQNLELPKAVQAFLGNDLNIASPAGYLSARYFGWVEILLIVYAVIAGTGAVAGEESAGTIDLLLSQPVPRSSMIIQKAAASVAGSAMIISIGWLGFALSVPLVSIRITLADTAIASANMLPITLLFYAIALWLGAVAPNRSTASGAAIGLATGWYFVSTLANGVGALHGLKYATPFYYYGSGLPLVEGIDWAHVGVLTGVALAFVLLTLRAFERRDIATGSDIDLFGAMRRVWARS